MNEFNKAISKTIAKYCFENNLTYKQIAEKAEISYMSFLKRVENMVEYSTDDIYRISQALGYKNAYDFVASAKKEDRRFEKAGA